MSQLHRHTPYYYAEPKPRPSLAELWQLWRTREREQQADAIRTNRYDTSQRGSIDTRKSNAYHETLLEPEMKITTI